MGMVGHLWKKKELGLVCGCAGAGIGDWVKKGSFLAAWAVPPPPTFFEFLFIRVWSRHGCWATIREAVLATAD